MIQAVKNSLNLNPHSHRKQILLISEHWKHKKLGNFGDKYGITKPTYYRYKENFNV